MQSAVADEVDDMNGCRVDHIQTAMQEALDNHRRSVTDQNADIDDAYKELNLNQKRIVDRVMDTVCRQQQTIRMIVSGQGGTGKSRVIEMLNKLVSRENTDRSLPVAVSAPTGLAAFNVGGSTIHRLLSLPIEHGKTSRLQPLASRTAGTVKGHILASQAANFR